MDMQKEREALIAEIEVFKAEMLKSYVIKAWADSYVNTDPFSYTIFEDENNKIWWMKAQTYELWQMWQAAKARAVPDMQQVKQELLDRVSARWQMAHEQCAECWNTYSSAQMDAFDCVEQDIEEFFGKAMIEAAQEQGQ